MGLLYLMGQAQPNVRSLFASNEAGFAYDIGDSYGASEAKRTWRRNLALWSGQFDNSAWTKQESSIDAVKITDPLGTTNGCKAVPSTNSSNVHRVRQNFGPTNATSTLSVYAKADGYNWLKLRLESTGNDRWANFNLSDGTVGYKSSGTTAAVENAGNGWYRLSITGVSAGSINFVYFYIDSVDNNATENSTYAGDGTSGIYIFGAQLEISATPSEYQPITDFSTEFKQAYPTHSLYQDSNGVTPAVSPGDVVGLVIDSSKGGLANLGSELVTNGDFATGDLTGWTFVNNGTTTASVSGGVLNYSHTTYTDSYVYQAITCQVGKWYQIEGTTGGTNASLANVRVGSAINGTQQFSSVGEATIKRFFLATATTHYVTLRINSSSPNLSVTFDNISVKETPGNHAYQPTAGSPRPTLCRTPDGGRRNVLSYSEQFDNAAWTKTNATIAANATTAPDGTTTADTITSTATAYASINRTETVVSGANYTLSVYAKQNTSSALSLEFRGSSTNADAVFNLADGTVTSGSGTITSVGSGWYRCSISKASVDTSEIAIIGFRGTATTSGESIFIWGAQLEVGSSATNLQKVTVTHDVTEAGKRDCWGLSFDGSDDFLQTSSISFGTHTQDTRRNLLVDTESFGASSWVLLAGTVTENTTTAPDGTTTADTYTGSGVSTQQRIYQVVAATGGNAFSVYVKAGSHNYIQLFHSSDAQMVASFDVLNGVVGFTGTKTTANIEDVGGGWYRCSVTWSIITTGNVSILLVNDETATFNAASDTSGNVYLWGAQVESGTLTDYQRVGTDKMTVMAGVRKNSDAARGFVCELTTTWQGNNGAFAIEAPASAASASYRIASKGTASDSQTITTYTAPITNVVTIQANIAAPSLIGRVNGVQVSSTSVSQGSGNYSNAVLYIGHRGAGSDRFAGILYTLIIRGATTPTGTIANFERNLLAKRAGITF